MLTSLSGEPWRRAVHTPIQHDEHTLHLPMLIVPRGKKRVALDKKASSSCIKACKRFKSQSALTHLLSAGLASAEWPTS